MLFYELNLFYAFQRANKIKTNCNKYHPLVSYPINTTQQNTIYSDSSLWAFAQIIQEHAPQTDCGEQYAAVLWQPAPNQAMHQKIKGSSLVPKIIPQSLWRSAIRSFFQSLQGCYLLWCLTEIFTWLVFSSETLHGFRTDGLQFSLSSTDIGNCLSQQFLAPTPGPTISDILLPFNTFRIASNNVCWY